MKSRYSALSAFVDDSDEEEDSMARHDIPSYEDLSLYRTDEETVLEAVYAQDFSKDPGSAWGVHVYNIKVKPPDLKEKEIGCSLM